MTTEEQNTKEDLDIMEDVEFNGDTPENPELMWFYQHKYFRCVFSFEEAQLAFGTCPSLSYLYAIKESPLEINKITNLHQAQEFFNGVSKG